MSCDEELWTYCEEQEKKLPYIANFCYKFQEIYQISRFSKYVCHMEALGTYDEAIQTCEKINMTLMSIENVGIKKAFAKYFDTLAKTFWVSGKTKSDGRWYNVEKTSVSGEVEPTKLERRANSCMAAVKLRGFQRDDCRSKHFSFCGNTVIHKTNLNVCARKRDLFDLSNVYAKSACEILMPTTYDKAFKFCQSNTMDLFVINQTDIQPSFFKFALLSSDGPSWINGRREDLVRWYSQSYFSEKFLLPSGLIWSEEPQNLEKNCLSIVRTGRLFEVLASNCNDSLKFYCEYQK